MLFDLIMDLLTAGDAKEKERAYRRLEKVGVDRMTADVLATEFYKEWEAKSCAKETAGRTY